MALKYQHAVELRYPRDMLEVRSVAQLPRKFGSVYNQGVIIASSNEGGTACFIHKNPGGHVLQGLIPGFKEVADTFVPGTASAQVVVQRNGRYAYAVYSGGYVGGSAVGGGGSGGSGAGSAAGGLGGGSGLVTPPAYVPDPVVVPPSDPGVPIPLPAGYSAFPAGAASFDAGCDAAAKTYLPPATYSFSNFTQMSTGYYGAGLTPCVWLKGAGKAFTFIKMNSNTSSKGSAVAGLALGSTNPYHLLKIGSGSGRGGGPQIKYEDFTVIGTPQGHVYNGIRMDYGANGSVMRNVKITGIPGNDSTPPGETFAANIFKCSNTSVENCEFDGRVNETGSPVTASMLAFNDSDHHRVTDTTFKYCGVGFPVAAWQSTGGDYTRCTFDSNNRVPIHLENCDGVYNFRDCTWRNTREFHGVFASSVNWGTGEAVINIYDPVYDNFKGDGKFWWRMLLWPNLSYNTDIGSGTTPRAINLYVNGVLRDDLLHLAR